MNIRPDLMPDLQALLQELEARREAKSALVPKIASAEAAVARLQAQIADLDSQAAEAANVRIPADQSRVAQLVAGADVAQLDKKEIEARAAKARVIEVQRRQVDSDLAAVREHLGTVLQQASRADQALVQSNVRFLHALGDAVVDAYKRAARDFVAAFVPPLLSVADRLRGMTGTVPTCESVLHGLQIQWGDGEPIHDFPGARPRLAITQLWPRGDGTLASGNPVVSDALIDGIIEVVRTFPRSAAAARPA